MTKRQKPYRPPQLTVDYTAMGIMTLDELKAKIQISNNEYFVMEQPAATPTVWGVYFTEANVALELTGRYATPRLKFVNWPRRYAQGREESVRERVPEDDARLTQHLEYDLVTLSSTANETSDSELWDRIVERMIDNLKMAMKTTTEPGGFAHLYRGMNVHKSTTTASILTEMSKTFVKATRDIEVARKYTTLESHPDNINYGRFIDAIDPENRKLLFVLHLGVGVKIIDVDAHLPSVWLGECEENAVIITPNCAYSIMSAQQPKQLGEESEIISISVQVAHSSDSSED